MVPMCDNNCYFWCANDLVTDTEDDDGEALILKDISNPAEADALYEIVEDDEELKAVATVFGNMLEDVDLS